MVIAEVLYILCKDDSLEREIASDFIEGVSTLCKELLTDAYSLLLNRIRKPLFPGQSSKQHSRGPPSPRGCWKFIYAQAVIVGKNKFKSLEVAMGCGKSSNIQGVPPLPQGKLEIYAQSCSIGENNFNIEVRITFKEHIY